METSITLSGIEKTGNRVKYNFSYSDDLKEYFNPAEEFYIEYDLDKMPVRQTIADVPDSVLAIPFLCNVLPIAWVLDASIHVKEIDKQFYESIPRFKNGYVKMYEKYPAVKFNGSLTAASIIDNTLPPPPPSAVNKKLLFFSGGVDAFNSIIKHRSEKPALVTVWGSDVFFDDAEGWCNVQEHVVHTAEQFNTDYVFIKSNFRKFLNEGALHSFVVPIANDGWWHGFQHGVGLIGHSAPLVYLCKSETVYIASSFTAKEAGRVTCASDPTIDNQVKFLNCNVVHDGYEYSRQDKVATICKFTKKTGMKIFLRVCWESKGGKNCCHCEKDYRTMMAILAEGGDPNDFGFVYNTLKAAEIKQFLGNEFVNFRWVYIQKVFRKNRQILEQRSELKWILDVNFKKQKENQETWFSKRMLKRERLRFGVHLVEHCNLDCIGCWHFSPLAKPQFLSLDVFERDFKRLAELTGGVIDDIELFGGEPLLHPEITKFMELARLYFHTGIIYVVTNGLLLRSMDESFWQTAAKNNITIAVSVLPLNLDYDEIENIGKKYSVRVNFWVDKNRPKRWDLWAYDITGKQNKRRAFKKCLSANRCFQLVDGKLYFCHAAYIYYFNEYFGKEFKIRKGDYIDLNKVKNLESILKRTVKPIPFCRYCNIDNMICKADWQTSKKDIREWTGSTDFGGYRLKDAGDAELVKVIEREY
ncbi:hypothetical protein AGMMS50255_5560 [Spirochaetia bacterium]|nr:hypothetical protein AGMMS50255_5560 [Spirochaetia bacterium]